MWVLRKRENFCREKRVARRKQASILWWDSSDSFWSVSRNLWQSLSENISIFMKSLVQSTKAKSLLKMRGLRSINKWALKRVRSFLIFYVAWNSNEELARCFKNTLVLSDRKSLQPKEQSLRKCLWLLYLNLKMLWEPLEFHVTHAMRPFESILLDFFLCIIIEARTHSNSSSVSMIQLRKK